MAAAVRRAWKLGEGSCQGLTRWWPRHSTGEMVGAVAVEEGEVVCFGMVLKMRSRASGGGVREARVSSRGWWEAQGLEGQSGLGFGRAALSCSSKPAGGRGQLAGPPGKQPFHWESGWGQQGGEEASGKKPAV